MTFEARFYGRCADCGDDIEPGDDVRYEDDELIHDDCGTDDSLTVIRRKP